MSLNDLYSKALQEKILGPQPLKLVPSQHVDRLKGCILKQAGNDEVWTSIDYSPSLKRYVAVGYKDDVLGKSMYSNDGGNTWNYTNIQNAKWNIVRWVDAWNEFMAFATDSEYWATSRDGITWETRHNLDSNRYTGFAYSPKLNIGVLCRNSASSANLYFTLNAGNTWTRIKNTELNVALFGVCWSEKHEIFVAVGMNLLEDGRFTPATLVSRDGKAWSCSLEFKSSQDLFEDDLDLASSNTNDPQERLSGGLHKVAYSPVADAFVATERQGKFVAISRNGVEWRQVDVGVYGKFWDVRYVDAIQSFVIVNPGNRQDVGIYTSNALVSVDGLNWKPIDMPKLAIDPLAYDNYIRWRSFASSSKEIVFVAETRMRDPSISQQTTLGANSLVARVGIKKDDRVVHFPYGFCCFDSLIDNSSDSSMYYGKVVWGKNQFIATCRVDVNRTNISVSPTGENWTAIETPVAAAWYGLCKGYPVVNGREVERIVAVGSDGLIVYSDTDGTSWKQATVPPMIQQDAHLWAVCWSPELRQYLAIGNNGVGQIISAVSTNGSRWVVHTVNDGSTRARFDALTWVGGRHNHYIAMAFDCTTGKPTMYRSTNGMEWQAIDPQYFGVLRAFKDIAWGGSSNDALVAVRLDQNNQVLMSMDGGLSWRVIQEFTTDESIITEELRNVIYVEELGLFIVAPDAGESSANWLMSKDGAHWRALRPNMRKINAEAESNGVYNNGMEAVEGLAWSPSLKRLLGVKRQTTFLDVQLKEEKNLDVSGNTPLTTRAKQLLGITKQYGVFVNRASTNAYFDERVLFNYVSCVSPNQYGEDSFVLTKESPDVNEHQQIRVNTHAGGLYRITLTLAVDSTIIQRYRVALYRNDKILKFTLRKFVVHDVASHTDQVDWLVQLNHGDVVSVYTDIPDFTQDLDGDPDTAGQETASLFIEHLG